MVRGGSGGRRPLSFWKNTNQGNLMPAWRNTPAEAAMSASQTQSICCSAAEDEIIDLEMNPEVKGKLEMERAPMVPQIIVSGMVRNRPPRSVHFRFPVMYRTEPADISSSAL